MQAIMTIGLDIAKSVFQVHGIDASGQVILRRQLKRRYVLAFFQKLPPCLIGMEACASSHHWSRELQALGHTVRLMPPAYVKPYVKRQKNDATDAKAICEAVTRANMRFVPTKTPEQQSGLVLHRTRHLFIRQLDILCVLAVAGGETVSKNQLLDQVWPGLVVEENNLAVHISALRRELADGMNGQSLLVTVPGRGYRLIGLNEPATVQVTQAPQQWEGIPGASIAVLPFENLSTEPRQEYFADGVVEDIITGLARINWLSVIARNSTFTYKGKATDVNQVREELGVRYVL